MARGPLAARADAVRARVRAAYQRVWLPEGDTPAHHWQRIRLGQAVDSYIAGLGPANLSAAEISGDGRAHHPWRAFTSLNFPEFDLCAPLGDEGRFDVVICEQVLEHVEDPRAAAANLYGLCAPGGHVIVSTPFLIRVHELPAYGMKDYWRFTPRGLSKLLEGAGLVVEHVEGWGNRDCIVGNFDRWPAYRRWHSLRNEPDLHVQVWAFARRPSDG